MYGVRFVDKDDMPTGWMFVLAPEGRYLFIRADHVCPEVLEQAWAAAAALRMQHGHWPVAV